MTESLQQIANNDTPESVPVPQGARYLLLWALGRWGGGMVIALFFYHAWDREQTHAASQQDIILEAFRLQSKNAALTVKSLEAHTESIKSLTQYTRQIAREIELYKR